ncbi:PQQ-binding-like beta-propeller repeat protein [Catellatospora sp. NPDC049609]|uniref:outer membrane protein assembly factor BamB family protein n=1 Tax=Catellatospora sp. NPDC049609 TaxID=3155505 RepID=UPI003414C1D4
MSVDLDRLYARLAERADAAGPPPLSAVRARAARRRRRSLGGLLAAGAAVVAALFGAQAVLTPAATTPPPPRPWLPPAEAGFTPFDGTAPPVLAYRTPARFGMTATLGDRAFAMWLAEDGTEWVGGIDLTVQKMLWPSLSLGKFGDTNGMEVSPGAILLLTEQGFDNPLVQGGSDTIIAVDPDLGRIMWTLPYSFNDTGRVLYDDTLVLSRPEQGRVEALDLRTGKTRWSAAERTLATGLNPVHTAAEHHRTAGWSGTVPTDRRVVLHLADGRVQVRDVTSGRVERELAMPVLPAAGELTRQEYAVDGVLYQFAGSTVSRLPLDGSAPAVQSTLGSGLDQARVQPCGGQGRFCALREGPGDGATLWLVDAHSGATRWQQTVGGEGATILYAAPGVVAASRGRSQVFDPAGKPLAEVDGQAMWVGSGNLLVLGEGEVSGHQLATGTRVRLGSLTVSGFCSWNDTMLICPTEQGIGVYRYAN